VDGLRSVAKAFWMAPHGSVVTQALRARAIPFPSLKVRARAGMLLLRGTTGNRERPGSLVASDAVVRGARMRPPGSCDLHRRCDPVEPVQLYGPGTALTSDSLICAQARSERMGVASVTRRAAQAHSPSPPTRTTRPFHSRGPGFLPMLCTTCGRDMRVVGALRIHREPFLVCHWLECDHGVHEWTEGAESMVVACPLEQPCAQSVPHAL
jgi:hypothetical protein